MITALYAAPLALVFISPSMRTVRARRATSVAIGGEGNRRLARAMRVQANFAEYTPLTLVPILLSELQGLPAILVHGLGLRLLGARLLHAHGVSPDPENFRFRVIAMQMTFGALAPAATASFVSGIFSSSNFKVWQPRF